MALRRHSTSKDTRVDVSASDSLWKTRHPKSFSMVSSKTPRNVGYDAKQLTTMLMSSLAVSPNNIDSVDSTISSSSSLPLSFSSLLHTQSSAPIHDTLYVYVSYIDGDDSKDGLSPSTSLRTIAAAFDVIRRHGYNEAAFVRLNAGYYNMKDEFVSFDNTDSRHSTSSSPRGLQRMPITVEGVKPEKQSELYFTPKLDSSDGADSTKLWSLTYASTDAAYDVCPGDIIHCVADDQWVHVVYVASDGVQSTVRTSFNGELTPQRFLGRVYRFTGSSTNVCVSGRVNFASTKGVYFRNVRFVLDETSMLRFSGFGSLWFTGVYFVAKKGRNATVYFDSIRRIITGERVSRDLMMLLNTNNLNTVPTSSTSSDQANGSIQVVLPIGESSVGVMFESLSSNLDVVVSNSNMFTENLCTLDASLILRDSSVATFRNSYMMTTMEKAILYVCDLSTYHFAYARLFNVQTEAIIHEEPDLLNDCSVYNLNPLA